MPITVLCPGCKARFQVSEKFAGKQGPCPKCKGPITVPKLEDEVKVHAPEHSEAGAKDAKGRSTLKPIERQETKTNPVAITAAVVGTIAAFAIAWFVGREGFSGEPPSWLLAVGLIPIAPALVIAGYGLLRSDEELEPYRGRALWLRTAIVAVVYSLTWFGFSWLAHATAVDLYTELWAWIYMAPPFFVIGSLVALACLDLDFGSAFFHYSLFVLVTILLRLAMGMTAVPTTITPISAI